jgi:hypothetical protein
VKELFRDDEGSEDPANQRCMHYPLYIEPHACVLHGTDVSPGKEWIEHAMMEDKVPWIHYRRVMSKA